MNSDKDQKQRDPDLAEAEIAMQRAVAKACENARRNGAGFLSGRMAALSKSGRKRHLASDDKSFSALAYAAK